MQLLRPPEPESMGGVFAVVADEVRKLAERTAKSTREITDMLAVIQECTRAAVSSMNEGVTLVANGTNLANQAGNSIIQISESAELRLFVLLLNKASKGYRYKIQSIRNSYRYLLGLLVLR